MGREAAYPTADPTTATLTELQKQLRDAHRVLVLDGDGSEATLSSGELTVNFGQNKGRGVVVINPETGTADDLTDINQGSEAADEGNVLYIIVKSGDTITGKSTGNLSHKANRVMDNEKTVYAYFCDGTVWLPVGGSDIPLGASNYIFKMNVAGDDYEWVDPQTVAGSTTSDKLTGGSHSYSTSTERDLPSSSLVVDIPAIATVIVTGSLVGYCDVAAKHGSFWVNVGGVNYSIAAKIGTTSVASAAIMGVFENVPAGTVTVKLREKPEFGGNAVNVDQWVYTVLVIVE